MKTDMTTSPAPQPSSAEELALNAAMEFATTGSLCTHAGLISLALPLFTRLQESERVLVSALPAVKTMLEECYGTSDPDKIGDDEEWWPSFLTLATTHLNK